MKNFIICLKKEFLELFKNKKFLLFVVIVCIAGFLVTRKNFVDLSLLFIATVSLAICQFMLDTFKNDIETGGMIFLLNTKSNFLLLFLSKVFVSLFLGLIFFVVFYYANPTKFETFKLINYIILILGVSIATFLSVCIFLDADMINYLFSIVLGFICFKFSVIVNLILIILVGFFCYKAFFSVRFRSFLK